MTNAAIPSPSLLANFSEIRLSYETQKAAKKGLTLVQSLGMDVKRDRLAKLIDDLLENVGVLEIHARAHLEGHDLQGSAVRT